jgi:hypothetical protein
VAHGRRDLARLSQAPIAAEAVKRIDVLFAIEREIDGLAAPERLRVRQERSRPLINDTDPQAWPADVLTRINDHAIQRLGELLPWNWRKPMPSHVEAA